MTVTTVVADEVYTVRLYKSYTGYSWANTYEVRATQAFPSGFFAIRDMVDKLVSLEKGIHLQWVTIDRAVVSTYQPDSRPYNPESFLTIPINESATQPAVGEVLPLELCLYVRKNVTSGRFGKNYYRAAITEAGLQSDSFRPLLTSSQRNNLQTHVNNWVGAGALGTGWELVMAKGTPTPTDVRVVTGLTVERRVVVKQIGNRYFDRP